MSRIEGGPPLGPKGQRIEGRPESPEAYQAPSKGGLLGSAIQLSSKFIWLITYPSHRANFANWQKKSALVASLSKDLEINAGYLKSLNLTQLNQLQTLYKDETTSGTVKWYLSQTRPRDMPKVLQNLATAKGASNAVTMAAFQIKQEENLDSIYQNLKQTLESHI
jgi:putative lipoic acid-binding regulatory protein